MARTPKITELDRKLDELLDRTSLADVIKASDTSEALKLAAQTEAFSLITVSSVFEDFDRGQFPNLNGLTRTHMMELERHLNAYAVRARLADIAGHTPQSTCIEPRSNASKSCGQVSPISARTPDEVLSQTTLRELIFWSAGGEALKRRLGSSMRSPLLDTVASEFLADDEAEARYREVLGTRGFLDVTELVNAYILKLHQEAAKGR
jgi:hypothetical protein